MLDKLKLREKINDFIPEVKSAEEVYELFRLLNYPKSILFEVASKRKLQDFDFKEEVNKEINSVYTILSFGKNIPVFLFECKTLKLPMIRYITKILSEKYIRFLLILTRNYVSITFLFPEYEKIRTGEHKIKITRLNINKKELYWTDIETLSNLYYEGKETTWRDVWRKWREAFSVERVTEKFFEDYKDTFFFLRKEFDKQKLSRKQSHEFTLQLLNRIMFICFISKKGWLNKDPKFMKWLWKKYLVAKKEGQAENDSFYDVWLKQIFFKAFNNRQYDIKDLPGDVKEVLYKSPYLNGGLFTATDVDKLSAKINDSIFKRIFSFFERYNFAIKEDMPLEAEGAVDPQMLGYVYESLANVAEEIYDRNDLGIFYTPRVEVDFMCRRSLVEYLSKNIPEIPKEYIYRFVFDEDKESVEKYFYKENLWRKLEECLDNLSVVDPACGSGAFLVGMLNVLYELYKFIYKHIHRGFSDFDLKEEIISRSLYGVDIMPWAAHAAELRLWLQLIIETELSQEQLRKKPLLPNLNLNIRVGDSLVQEIGGLNLQLRTTNISDRLKRKLYSLKAEKERYFHNLSAKFSKKEEFIEEEARIFEEIIEDRINSLYKEIRILEAKIDRLKRTKQFNLYGDVSESEQKKLFDERRDLENNIIIIKKQTEILKNVGKNLKDPTKKPFIWDIDFAEIFGDKGGFDVVIGNPPYVRNEKISPPNKLKSEVTDQEKKGYKKKLVESVQASIPVVERIDRKSDYYIYFYFHGLSILNKKGTFCFITSNSWLDTGYGKCLQEFLLKYVSIAAIYDNPKRSFKHSDINTIIALFHAPQIQHEVVFGLNFQKEMKWNTLSNTAKFVMFKKPFSEVISSKNLIEIEKIEAVVKGSVLTELIKNLIHTDDYRVFPVTQNDLLEDGWEYPDDYGNGRFKSGNYDGNKWGSKFLRAPEIFFSVLKKDPKKVEKIGKYFRGERYLNTGGADGFYIVSELNKINSKYAKIRNTSKEGKKSGCPEFTVESEYFKPLIKDVTKYDKKPIIDKTDAWVLNLPLKKQKLKNLKIKKYVDWGEKMGFHKRSVTRLQTPWYKPTNQIINSCKVLLPRSFNDGYCIYYNPRKYVSLRYYRLHELSNVDPLFFVSLMNSTLFYLFIEIYGAKALGQGVLDIFMADFLKIQFPITSNNKIIEAFRKISKRDCLPIFQELGINPSKPIREQEPKPLPDRAELDNIIFNELGLTQEERKEVYYAVCELVKNRLEKARSLKK